ncbi:MAG: hypothetical protein IJQ37_04910 [Clostridia bacterium]|nr:hypothetical protein [Clostridia bacterium]
MKNHYIKRVLMALTGMFIYAFGVFLTIRADVGIAPWNVFFMAISNKLGVSFGAVTVVINIIILCAALGLKEKIGLITILDTLISGPFVDLFDKVIFKNVVFPASYVWRYFMLFASMIIMSLALSVYMRAAIGCGPRDSLMLGLGKRSKKIPVGIVCLFLDATVFGIGCLIDITYVGIGTAVLAFLFGPIMTLTFKIMKFEPKNIIHEDIITTFRNIFHIKPHVPPNGASAK